MEQLEQRPFLCVNFSVFCSRGAVSRREAVRSQIQEKRKSFSLLLWSSLEQCEKKRKKFPILHWSGMEQFKEQLVVEFETYLNGQKIHHDDIAKGISEILHKSIGDAMKNIKISI